MSNYDACVKPTDHTANPSRIVALDPSEAVTPASYSSMFFLLALDCLENTRGVRVQLPASCSGSLSLRLGAKAATPVHF